MPDSDLPVILVSATELEDARKFISDLIGDKYESSEADENGSAETRKPAHVWTIENKYYSANVRVQTADEATGEDAQRVEAHLVLLRPREGVADLRRLTAAEGGRRAEVKMALQADMADAVHDAAREAGYEPVEAEAGRGEDEGGAEGMERVQEALHAHVWPGLRARREAATLPAPLPLSALRSSRDHVAQLGLSRDERLLRAEALLDAFARALVDDDDDR